MYTLKYLRTLDMDKLKSEYQYNRKWQLKWFDIYEEQYKHGIRDKDVSRKLEEYTKAVQKIERVINEKEVY